MKLASHNSMTYLPPKKWWLYPFRFIARCQSKSIQEQYERYNVRMFDLRISFNKLIPEFRHGMMAYKGDVEEVLMYLNAMGDTYVRLIYETSGTDEKGSILFREYCKLWNKKYKGIKFFCGRRKSDWKELYHFKYNPTYENKYSSMNTKEGTTGTVLDDWFPLLYAKFNNRKNLERGTDKEFLMIDFVNIR